MSDLKISQLTTNPGIDGTETMPTAKSGSNFKNTLTALKTWILSGISGYVKTDGTTTGATSQAQEFTLGITATGAGGTPDTSWVKKDEVRVGNNGTQLEAKMGVNGEIAAVNNNTSSYSKLKPDGTIQGLNVAHPNALTTPADAIKVNGVKVYRALLSQSGTDAPVPTVLENTLGEDPTTGYDSNGNYKIETSGNVFVSGKTFVTMTHIINGDPAKTASFTKTSETRIAIYSFASGVGADDIFSNTEIQILIYP